MIEMESLSLSTNQSDYLFSRIACAEVNKLRASESLVCI